MTQFEISLDGASERQKASVLVNCLDAVSANLIMPKLQVASLTYKNAKCLILEEFGGPEMLTTWKMAFLNMSFKRDKRVVDFAENFYREAQILSGSHILSDFDACIALQNVYKPFQSLYQAMLPAFNLYYDISKMVDYLCCCDATFDSPNRGNQDRFPSLQDHIEPRYKHTDCQDRPTCQQGNLVDNPQAKPDWSKVVCRKCNKTGHFVSQCQTGNQKEPNVHLICNTEEGKAQAE